MRTASPHRQNEGFAPPHDGTRRSLKDGFRCSFQPAWSTQEHGTSSSSSLRKQATSRPTTRPDERPVSSNGTPLHSKGYLTLLLVAAMIGLPLSLIAFGFLVAVGAALVVKELFSSWTGHPAEEEPAH